jgi:glycosyltransferase involved in cell wall biosynthesis
MRVLHVTHQYPPALGGSERYIADISEELVRRGHQVDVFTSRSVDFHTWRNELQPFEERNGVNVYRFRSVQRRRAHWQMLHWGGRRYWQSRTWPYELLLFLGGGPLCPGMFWQLLSKGAHYDLIHLNCLVYAHVAYGYAAARLQGLPVVTTPHVHAEQEITHGLRYQRSVLRGSDHILADTPGEQKFLVKLGLDGSRITVGGTGLQPENYPWRDRSAARLRLDLPLDAFVILFLGRKSEYKGLELTLEAFQALQSVHPEVHLLAAGPGTAYSRKLLDNYRALPGFRDLGAVSEDLKTTALNACDCLVLPSSGEAFGIVYLEAWICGKPVVGARTAAVSTVIEDGQDGFLVEPGSVNDLVNRLAYLLENPATSHRLGCAGRSKVLERYTISRLSDVVEGTYLRTLRRCSRESKRKAT